MQRRSEASSPGRECREFLAALPGIAWTCGPDGALTFVSRRAVDYTGLSAEDQQGRGWEQSVHSEDRECVAAAWAEAVRCATSIDVVFRARRHDGVFRHFRSQGEPLWSGQGELLGWSGLAVDIEEEVRRDEAHSLVLEAAELGMWYVDLSTARSEWSSRLREMLGIAPDAGIDFETCLARVHPEDRERVREQARQALDPAGTGEHRFEHRVLLPDGTVRWLAARGRTYFAQVGGERRAVRVAGTVDDITQRKLAELERARALDVLEQGEPCCVFDAQFSFIYVNRGWEELMGMSRDRALGRGVWDLFAEAADPEGPFWREYHRVMAERTPGEFQIHYAPLDLWADVRVHPAVHGGIAAFFRRANERKQAEERIRRLNQELAQRNADLDREIAEQRRTEEALRSANQQLAQADQHKNEFLAVLAHELRNPLAPIRNSAFILGRAQPGGPQARHAAEVIDRQSRQLGRLIDDLLDVTRISRGKIRLQPERIDVFGMVRHTAEDQRPLFERSGVALEVRVPDQPMFMEGDPTRLAQVVENLLHNAAKFTPRGGHAWVSAGVEDGQAVIRVRDDGAGIPPEILPGLFEPFVQSELTVDRSRGGLGLGLALVRGLVAMHSGEVRATSAGLGKGTEFTIRLPVQPDIRAVSEAPPTVAGAGGRRVLVIEDNRDAAESLKEALELSAHQVEIAADGPSGLETAHAFRPEVVLCDIGLPVMDGYEVARRMRGDPELHALYLVALSGYASQEDVDRAHAVGFDRHMAKPPNLETLERLLAEFPA